MFEPHEGNVRHKETTSESNLFKIGLNIFRLGRFAEAAEYFDKAIKNDQENAGAWNMKGNCLQMMDRDAEAISCYKKALEINHTDANSWYNKARAEEKLGQLNYAMISYYKFLEFAPATMSEHKRDAAEKFKQLLDLRRRHYRYKKPSLGTFRTLSSANAQPWTTGQRET